TGAGVGVRAIHDRDDAVGPIDAGHVGREDPGGVPTRLLLLRQEDLVISAPQRTDKRGVPIALGGGEQRSGEVDPDARSIAAWIRGSSGGRIESAITLPLHCYTALPRVRDAPSVRGLTGPATAASRSLFTEMRASVWLASRQTAAERR